MLSGQRNVANLPKNTFDICLSLKIIASLAPRALNLNARCFRGKLDKITGP